MATNSSKMATLQWILENILHSATPQDIWSGKTQDIISTVLYKLNISLSKEKADQIDMYMRSRLDLGPKNEGMSTVIPITIIYAIIFITGVVGNVSTCLVITRHKYMRTVTNYYLFNLSVSDLLLLISGLPLETYKLWVSYPDLFGQTFCRFRLLAAETSSNVSVLTITAFTVERYIAICHPIRNPTRYGLTRPLRIVLAVWLVSTMCAIPVCLQFGTVYKEWNGHILTESAQCNVTDIVQARIVFQVSTSVFFALPMLVISILYFFIGIAVRKSTLIRSSSDSSGDAGAYYSTGNHHATGNDARRKPGLSHQAKVRRSVLKMLVAVVVAFFVCWAPFHVQRLMAVCVSEWSPLLDKLYLRLYNISAVCYYLSATINPVLYSIMSLKFRQAFRASLANCCCCWPSTRPRRSARNSYTFKFVPRGHFNTHCTVVDSSSSGSHNGNNNKTSPQHRTPGKDAAAVGAGSPVMCCASGNTVMSRFTPEDRPGQDGKPLVEMAILDPDPCHSSSSPVEVDRRDRLLGSGDLPSEEWRNEPGVYS